MHENDKSDIKNCNYISQGPGSVMSLPCQFYGWLGCYYSKQKWLNFCGTIQLDIIVGGYWGCCGTCDSAESLSANGNAAYIWNLCCFWWKCLSHYIIISLHAGEINPDLKEYYSMKSTILQIWTGYLTGKTIFKTWVMHINIDDKN